MHVKVLLQDHIVGDSFVFRASFLQVRGAKTMVLREAGSHRFLKKSDIGHCQNVVSQLGGRTFFVIQQVGA